METTIGQKIKNFRIRAELSQLDLETAINASPGSISRIENDKVNPTKETLRLIGDTLNLARKEIADLFEIYSLQPNQVEVEKALHEIEAIFSKPEFTGYLLDDWWILRAVSPGLVNFLNIKESTLNKAIDKNILEVLFDPMYEMREKLDPEKLISNYAIELARARLELNEDIYPGYFAGILEKIRNTPRFAEIEAQSISVPKDLLTAGSRISYLQVGGQKIKVMHAREKLKDNPRFETIEFFNPQPYE